MPSYREALNTALIDSMQADDDVFVFGLDVPDCKRIYGSTNDLVERFGEKRCFGTPISEDAMTGVAIGAAFSGLRPVHVHIRADFMLLACNQIANIASSASYLTGGQLKIPLVIRAVIGRGWGQGAQHSKSLQSWFAHLPGIKVVMPASPQDAYSLLRSAIEDDSPVIFLEHRWLYDVEGDIDFEKKLALGKCHLKREGSDITLVSTSWMTVEAVKAAEILAEQGIKVEVIDVATVSPFDYETVVQSVAKTGRCLVADYDWEFCGLSAEIVAQVQEKCFEHLKGPVERIGFKPTPCPTTRVLENNFYPSAKTIIERIEDMLELEKSDLSSIEFYSWEKRFKGPF
ncbi:MAG: pyruvate/2-oxoglutarate/acetoin dehydrogenase E1 component [Candidatus Omnitrophota bacterium]|jgi:pyruvate/2-oxoglutarate/acetoin dehydrogenase E1 component